MAETVTHYQAKPVEVAGCPSQHKGPVRIVSVKVEHPEDIFLAPGVITRNSARLIGWNLSCGCFLSGRKFELVYMPEKLPEFRRREGDR